ncbi:response regulator receiver protein [Mucilaginibacter sp. PPCGB 2223]|uniref:response regulator n=1 Tax=Mucilaginibacter sp. PPCGB 2223 TaxID=1886027 RepID=UPI0008249A61|nr:response regulator [Mucilaginibacter sp. PPCGB 2223]OCX50911.1 response regulator receiver protein [Mucilaginibacter sp. PPCGB 2223]
MTRKKILVVEDDEFVVEAMTMILEEQGFEVASSTNGEIFNQDGFVHPDLILLDIRLSGRDRRDICKWIKDHPGMKHIPVILISGNRDIHKIHKECGADDYIVKPFDLNELLSKVNLFTGC